MEQRLMLIGGLPGSGKSTRAKEITLNEGGYYVEADMYLYRDGVYRFEPAKLGEAHAWCQGVVQGLMVADTETIVVANTFSRQWERQPYVALAELFGYDVEWVDLFDAGLSDAELAARNVHGVPAEAIGRMRERWER